jgi:glycosyltransferase involved in cell wall biosynthesis
MRRLLLLCEYPTLLGGERSMLATLPVVAAASFEILVAAPPSGALADELRDRGVSQIAWQTRDHDRRIALDELRSELAAILRRTRPDLLHANSLSTARISGPVASACLIPSIGHLRDILKLPPQSISDLNAHRRLLAVSRVTRDFHVGQGIVPTKCVVLYNGIDLCQFSPGLPTGYLHRELGLPDDVRFAAIIGQLGLRKGTDVALSAAFEIAPRFPKLHWLVVGQRTSHKQESHDFESLLHSIADEPPLAGRVHFLGCRIDVHQILCECDLLVHAARQEPLGRVLLEAAASGIAVVATDVGGTREIFPADAGAARLVPPDNRSAIAQAIGDLLLDDSLRTQLAAAARRRAETAFDIQTAAVRLLDHYHDLLP